MNKFKKALMTLVAAVTVATNVAGLASCGKKSDPIDFTGNVDVVAYNGSKVTVTFYHSMGKELRDLLDTHIEKFNAIYPNITIKTDKMGDYDTIHETISTEILSKSAPSLAYCYPDHVAHYNSAQAVVILDDYINSDDVITNEDGTPMLDEEGNPMLMGYSQAQLDDFIEGYYNEGKAYGDGKMYTLPFSKSTELLYYNKTAFEENGWSVPTTWEEMATLCEKIKTKFPTDIPLGYDSEANWFITMTEQLGTPYTSATGEHFVFDTPENQAFVATFSEWYQKQWVTTEELYGSYTSELFTETLAKNQKAYMCIGSSAGATYQHPDLNSDGTYPFEVGVATIPQVDPTNPKVIQQGPSLCLFKQNDPQTVAGAWLFAKYLTTCVELQADVSMNNGYTPVIKSAQQDPYYADFLAQTEGEEGLKAAAVKHTLQQAIDYPNIYYVSPAFNGSSDARTEVGKLMMRCFTYSGSNPTSKIASEFAETINKLRYEL